MAVAEDVGGNEVAVLRGLGLMVVGEYHVHNEVTMATSRRGRAAAEVPAYTDMASKMSSC